MLHTPTCKASAHEQSRWKSACTDQAGLGAKDLNKTNYTTPICPAMSPCDWLQQPLS